MSYYKIERLQRPGTTAQQQFTQAGYHVTGASAKRVGFTSLELAGGVTPDCYEFSSWFDSSNVNAFVQYSGVRPQLPANKIRAINAANVIQTGQWRNNVASLSTFRFIKEVDNLLFNVSSADFALLLDGVVLPEFYRRFPGGKVGYVGVNNTWTTRMPLIRSSAAAEMLTWPWARQGQSFATMRGYHLGPSTSFDKWLGAFLGVLVPEVSWACVERLPGWLVFVFDRAQDVVALGAQEPSAWDLVGEPFDSVARSHAGGGRRSMLNLSTTQDVCDFIEDGIGSFNKFLTEITAPEHYLDSAGAVNFAQMFMSMLQFDRIMLEVGTAATSNNHFIRKLFGFSAIDKIAAIGTKRALKIKESRIQHLSKGKQKEIRKRFSGLDSQWFSRLLIDSVDVSNFSNALRRARSPRIRALANALPILQTSLSSSVLSSLINPNARRNNKVLLSFRDSEKGVRARIRSMDQMEYVREFLRQVRNTHHGYGLHRSAFQKLLAGHTGVFGDAVADIALIIWHAALQDHRLLTSGDWVLGLKIERTVL